MSEMLNKGFSLVEALISVMIVTFIVFSVLNSVTLFSIITRNDIINFCLRQAANSASEFKRANPTNPVNNFTFSCKDMHINVRVYGGVPPPNRCIDVTIVAMYRSHFYRLRDKICNF